MLAFFIAQARVREPMLPLSLFRIPSFTGVQLGAFAIAGSQFALFLYLTLYLQNILGYSPLEAGVRYLPLTVVSFFVAPLSGQVMHRIQPRFLIGGGLLLAGVGLILMSGVEEGDTWTTLLPGFLLGGIGIGMLNPPTAAVSVSVVERAQSGMAAGINNTFRQVGISVGIAAYGAIFLDRASSEIAERAPGTDSHGLSEAVSSGNLPAGPENVVHAAREGFFAGFNEILLIGAGLAIAGAIAAVLLVRPQDMRSDVPAPAPAA
jgi:fucose permease